MNHLDFCKSRLEELVEHTASPDKLAPKVEEFMKHRMPVEPAHRAGLMAWAQNELARLESSRGSGVTKLVSTAVLAKASRRMLMFQIVIREIASAPASAGTLNDD